MEKARNSIVNFFNTLSSYDYIGFFLVILLFSLFLILALLLRKKTKISMLFVVIAFIFFFAGPTTTHIFVQNTIFKSKLHVEDIKKLIYSDTLLIKGSLLYEGKKDANHCQIEASVHKVSSNSVKDFVYGLKSFASGNQTLNQSFTKGKKVDFKIVIEPFNYKGDYNITLDSGCFI